MKINLENEKDSIIDDLAVGYTGEEKITGVHLERMDSTYYWLGIDLADGTTMHIDIFKSKDHKKKISARLRERT